jgi:hypothetical protein
VIHSNNHQQKVPHLESIRQFCQWNPAFTEGAVRHLIFNEHHNGFAGCFPKIGRRRFVNVDAFFERVQACSVKENANG